jgi:hypothetical protein
MSEAETKENSTLTTDPATGGYTANLSLFENEPTGAVSKKRIGGTLPALASVWIISSSEFSRTPALGIRIPADI